MAKKNFQKTPLERAQHERAVKVRKMTDSQLCDFLDMIAADKGIKCFLELLEQRSYRGISTATVTKLKDIALQEGFIEEV